MLLRGHELLQLCDMHLWAGKLMKIKSKPSTTIGKAMLIGISLHGHQSVRATYLDTQTESAALRT